MAGADQRLQQVADQPAAAAVVLEPGHRQSDQRVHRPRMQAPMEERVAHRRACGRMAFRLQALGRLEEVRDRFRGAPEDQANAHSGRSEEHTSELQSLMRISYAGFCLKKKTNTNNLAQIT